jgi:ribosomal-protein-alanine N-acetyltransferase
MDELRSGTELEVLTSRLLVRLTQEPDAEALLKILRDHRVSSRFLEPVDANDREARAYLVRDSKTWKNEPYLHFTALRREESTAEYTVVGAAQLFDGEISYCIDPTFWYQGYGYEFVHAICDIARDRLGLKRLFAKVLRDNPRSRRILERLGFLFCGLEYLPHAFRGGKYAVLTFALDLGS